MGRKTTSRAGPQQLTAATVRSVARALEGILAEVQAGAAFPLTRMTRVKRLCSDQAAGDAFATFVAAHSVERLVKGKRSKSLSSERREQFVVLARDGLARLEEFLASRSPETERALRAQGHALYQAQNEHKNIPYGAVRLIVCWEAMQVERAIDCVLSFWPEERARYGYELAGDYVKGYVPGVFGDLNRASAEPLAEVISFWRGYADLLAANEQAAGEPEHGKGE